MHWSALTPDTAEPVRILKELCLIYSVAYQNSCPAFPLTSLQVRNVFGLREGRTPFLWNSVNCCFLFSLTSHAQKPDLADEKEAMAHLLVYEYFISWTQEALQYTIQLHFMSHFKRIRHTVVTLLALKFSPSIHNSFHKLSYCSLSFKWKICEGACLGAVFNFTAQVLCSVLCGVFSFLLSWVLFPQERGEEIQLLHGFRDIWFWWSYWYTNL